MDPLHSFREDRRPFRFGAAWMLHPDFIPMVESNLATNSEVSIFIPNLKRSLLIWNRFVFGNINRRKKTLMSKLEAIQSVP